MAETLGERVRRLRESRGVSQRDAAAWATASLNGAPSPGKRVTYAYVSRIESGQRTPSVRAIRALAVALGVTPYWLEHGRPDPATELLRRVVEAFEPPQRLRDANVRAELLAEIRAYVAEADRLDNDPEP